MYKVRSTDAHVRRQHFGGAGIEWCVEVFSEPTETRKGSIFVVVRNQVVRRVEFGARRRNRKDAFRRAIKLAEGISAQQ